MTLCNDVFIQWNTDHHASIDALLCLWVVLLMQPDQIFRRRSRPFEKVHFSRPSEAGLSVLRTAYRSNGGNARMSVTISTLISTLTGVRQRAQDEGGACMPAGHSLLKTGSTTEALHAGQHPGRPVWTLVLSHWATQCRWNLQRDRHSAHMPHVAASREGGGGGGTCGSIREGP